MSLFVDLFFVGADYITVLWGNVPADRSALNLVMPGGPWAWLFWVEWIAGGVIPAVDAEVLIRDHGVARVFGPGTDTHDIVDYIHERLGI